MISIMWLRIAIYIAEWLIQYFKERNGFLSEELKRALERDKEFQSNLEKHQQNIMFLEKEIQKLDTDRKILRNEIGEILSEIRIAKKEKDEKLQELSDIIDAIPDEDIIREEL